jgi:hypothetical protein
MKCVTSGAGYLASLVEGAPALYVNERMNAGLVMADRSWGLES